MVLHERRTAAPSGFFRQGAAPANVMITLRIALTSNNVANLEEKLKSIAAPESPDFRRWLSMEEVKAFVQPSSKTLSAFNTFASANGLTPTVVSPNDNWVSVTLPVYKANKLFAAQFDVFTHLSLKHPITRILSVSLPSDLVGQVEVLHPTTHSSSLMFLVLALRRTNRRGPDTSCNSTDPAGVITPACLQDLYGIPATPATQTSNTLLVTGYVDEWAQISDFTQFLTLVRPDISPNTTFTLSTADNGTNPQDPNDAGFEANLDIQYTMGLATGVPTQFLSVGGFDFPTALIDTTTFLDGIANPHTVMTTSYGNTESRFGASYNPIVKLSCFLMLFSYNRYMALGARGISVIFASGDGGVHGMHDATTVCTNNTFMPVFPAVALSIYQGFAPEKATNFTGGGFSDYFPTPYYQTEAVTGFLGTIPYDFSGTFSKTGCGHSGWNFEMVAGGEVILDGGTSASSPTFASIIALINDRLVAAEKPVLGFLNPWLYSKASSAFTDITIGHNSGLVCPTSSVAFDAATGWDPLTGFGTPKFDDLLAAALA
ncbi:subtilisin-like protein [Mycena leptocephala]|nr:subtilisin-like protein [Mycena leptocephala]